MSDTESNKSGSQGSGSAAASASASAEKATGPMWKEGEERTITVRVLPGSQYCNKLLAALDSKHIPYYVHFVNPRKLDKELPPPHMVPVVDLVKGGETETMVDSKAILQKCDELMTGAAFYPSDDVTALDAWLDSHFNVMVWYYNWVDEDGFNASIAPRVAAQIPWFAKFFLTPQKLLKKRRGELSERVAKVYPDVIGNAEAAAKQLADNIKELDGHLKTDEQQWLCGTDEPSAADFGAFGMIHHLVGESGDAKLMPCRATALKDADVPRLSAWWERISTKYPLQYLNKRPPKK